MPFIYRNSKGRDYHLCEAATKTGKPRLVFSRDPVGKPLEEMPAGFEVFESVNGQVSIRKAGTSAIRMEEVEIVRNEIARHRRLFRYRVEAKKKSVVVFEPCGASADEIAEVFGMDLARAEQAVAHLSCKYDPVFRFNLVDPRTRTFAAERMCYKGSMEGWLSLHDGDTLPRLAARYVRHLGAESFFELI